jgi:hypothetical protein
MFRVLLTGLLIVTLAGAARAETYCVATDGKPENDGPRDKPWPSVEFALQKVGGGHNTLRGCRIHHNSSDVDTISF